MTRTKAPENVASRSKKPYRAAMMVSGTAWDRNRTLHTYGLLALECVKNG